MERVKIYRLRNLEEGLFHRIMDGLTESARLWNFCVETHKQARTERTEWPDINKFHDMTKGRFNLGAQSVQQVCRAFLSAVGGTLTKRADGDKQANFPHKEKSFYPLMWPAQGVCVQRFCNDVDGTSLTMETTRKDKLKTFKTKKTARNKVSPPKNPRLILTLGKGRPSIVLSVKDLTEHVGSVKIVWNRGLELHVQTETEYASKMHVKNRKDEVRACVDLGEIHLAAVVTNKGDAEIITGRGIRSIKRQNNLTNREISKLQSRCKKGSRRWKKLNAARRRLNGRSERRVKDARHKATRAVIDFCVDKGVRTLFVGNPDGVRKKSKGRKFNQKLSQWEYGKDKQYLMEKAEKAGMMCFTGNERYTSSTCPSCGRRRRPRGRRWICSEKTGGCGFSGHRDIVGAVNMHAFTFRERVPFPDESRTTYLQPARDSRRRASGGEQ